MTASENPVPGHERAEDDLVAWGIATHPDIAAQAWRGRELVSLVVARIAITILDVARKAVGATRFAILVPGSKRWGEVEIEERKDPRPEHIAMEAAAIAAVGKVVVPDCVVVDAGGVYRITDREKYTGLVIDVCTPAAPTRTILISLEGWS